MSDIAIQFSPLEWITLALIAGSPGLVVGAALGALLWRRHRVWGALAGAVIGLVLFDAGVWVYMVRPWSL